jgi:hypothetical protein
MVWAEEFCRIFDGYTVVTDEEVDSSQDVDPGTMVAWFANAMQTAIDLSGARYQASTAAFIAALGKNSEPPEEEDPEELLTAEEQFLAGFEEGRADGPS